MKLVLMKLQEILHVELSAKEIARKMKCSVPTAYRRLGRLRNAGAGLSERSAHQGKTGPVPTKYRVVVKAES